MAKAPYLVRRKTYFISVSAFLRIFAKLSNLAKFSKALELKTAMKRHAEH